MNDEVRLAEAVDEAMAPVAEELWAPVRERVLELYRDLGLAPMPWRVEELVALVRARAKGGASRS